MRTFIAISTLFLVSLSSVSASSFSVKKDSIGIEKKDGKIFVLHKVESKETLYSLSKRYKVEIDAIRLHNPEAAAGLKEGQVIRIPTGTEKAEVKTAPVPALTHTVEAKETFFSISRKYNVTVEDIQKANPGISASDLKPGQTLKIPAAQAKATEPDKKSEEKKPEIKKAEEKKPEEKKTEPEVKKAEVNVPVKEISIKNEEPEATPASASGGHKRIAESGFAEMIADDSDTPKFLALHKTAPIGTIIQVTNTANNEKIFVRVIGKLPPSGGNDKVVIKISQKAYEKLSGVDKKIPVQLSYIP